MVEQNAQADLEFIRRIMQESRRLLIYDGKEWIAWGVLVAIGMLLMYTKFVWDIGFPPMWLWTVIIGLGWVYSIRRAIRRTKARTSTIAGRIMGVTWLACGIVMTTIGFVLPATGAIKTWAIIPIIAIVIAIAYGVTAAIHGSRFLYAAACGWWIGGLVMAIWPGYSMFLIFAAMITLFQIVPGVLFYRKWKLEIVRPT